MRLTNQINNEKSGDMLVFFAALSWSTAGLFTRIVSTDFPTTLFWRSLFGGLSVLVIYYLLSSSADRKKIFTFTRGETVISLLITIGMLCFISSFFYTSVANVSFIYGLMPLVTFILSVIFLKAKINNFVILICTVSMVGVAFIMWEIKDFGDKVGLLLAFGMTLFMASLTIAAKFYPSADVRKSTYLSAFLGTIIIFPFSDQSGIITTDYYWLALYGLTNVGLGFGVYLIGVTRTTAISAALIGLFEIPLAPVWTWMLYDEEVSLKTIGGGSIIILCTITYIIYSNKWGGVKNAR